MTDLESRPPNADPAKSAPAIDEEELLATILSEITDRQNRGEQVDVQLYCDQNPSIADELRKLFAAVMITDVAGKQPTVDWDDSHRQENPIECPYRFGDFELIEEIGRGGMGVVFKARHLALDRIVALKMILAGEFASAEDRSRFMAEASSAAKLQHPSIVAVHEVGQHEGRLFFCMEYVSGNTLLQELKSGPCNPRRAAKILLQVVQAMAYAHDKGVLHRDLKPSNILINENGDAKITDFGLAKNISNRKSLSVKKVTLTGAVIGTPAYMSPEQAAGARGEIGPASDVYSIGSILYYMLTGSAPFQGSSPMDTLLMVLDQDPIPPRIVNRNADRELEMICLRCLQKPADLRYQTAGDLATDLQAFLNNEPISARGGRIGHFFARVLRETQNAQILENWGLLWMWHSLVLMAASYSTNILQLLGIGTVFYYLTLWVFGLGAWAAVFWFLRRRMGPVTFIERQIAHVWAGSMICVAGLFPIEMLMGMEPLRLSPCLGLVAAMTFVVKGGILSGTFYIPAVALFITALVMAAVPQYSHFIFGTVAALCFFIPGLFYYRRKLFNELQE